VELGEARGTRRIVMARKLVRGICSNCEKEATLELVTKEQVITVRKEPIKVNLSLRRCGECGDEVLDPAAIQDPFDLAYREYRKRHGLLQPEEIRDWRNARGLTQVELARLIGLGAATLNRYENGSLQDVSHDRLLRLAMDPSNLLKFVERSEGTLAEPKREALLRSLRAAQADTCTLENAIMVSVANYEADEYSGYKKLDLPRFYNAVLFFCKEGIVKTKLNKLLFYADFRHFKKSTLSITGARYAHLPHGPTPDNFEWYYAAMRSLRLIDFIEEQYPGGYVGEVIRAEKDADLNMFDSHELLTLASVMTDFEKYTAVQMKALSHQEPGYEETENGELISYEYALQLKH
jgi:putative zinc finger/helix-turn-helix YgiT family protein